MSEDYREDLILARTDAVDREHGSYMRPPVLVTAARGAVALLADHVQSLLAHQHEVDDSAKDRLESLLLGRRALERPRWRALSVAEVAYSHGFVSSAHFCRAFKARFGMSPSEARAQAGGPLHLGATRRRSS